MGTLSICIYNKWSVGLSPIESYASWAKNPRSSTPPGCATWSSGSPEHCPNCGTEIPQGVSFCPGCGKAVSREEAPRQPQQDAPSGTVPAGQTLTTPETPQQQPAVAPPQAPPSGGGRAQRGIVLGIFAVVAVFMLLTFLVIGAVVLLLVLSALL